VNPRFTIHELIAWQLDEFSYRDSSTGLNKDELSDRCERAKQNLIEGVGYEQCSALLSAETAHIQDLPDVHAQRPDLRQEYEGLDWLQAGANHLPAVVISHTNDR
jgi:hypothetical protein